MTKVRDHFFMLTGAGGNVAALVFPEGITLVDSGRVEMSDKLLAALRTLSAQPVRYIINTSRRSRSYRRQREDRDDGRADYRRQRGGAGR